jgi:serine/threonine protein kinase
VTKVPDASRQTDPSAAAIDDPRVAAAMEDYLNALEAGQCPPRQPFLAQHPEIAGELASCLEGLDLVHEAARVLRQDERPESPLTSEQLKLPLGDFRIVREIGRGGMGVVYEAVQLSLGRRVALKVLPLAAALDPKHLQRFKNEAQAAAQLHHTNIVPVYAVGSERGVHYYSMQLIDGYSLADLVEHRRQLLGKSINLSSATGDQLTEKAIARSAPARKPLATDVTEALGQAAALPAPSQETLVHRSTFKTASERNASAYNRTAAGLIRQAALALEHAHQLGVIHRDIKPANLLLDERGNIWITDFGLALFQANLQITRTGDMLGTMRYMSPEQASGDRVVLDHRTDIYSLGITLYELLTLQPAIAGGDPHTVLRRIMDDEPRPPRAIDKHIPLELETIVLKSIAKTPAERYATAAEMADDLQRWLDDQPIRARRPTLLEHAARWSRRHWPLLAAAAGILGVATLGLLLSTVIISSEHADTLAAYKRESQQRAFADRQRQAAEQQRKAADESFRQARQAVDTFLALSEEELAGKPPLHQLRRRFLNVALEYYNAFLEQRRADPAVRDELVETSQWVRQIVDELAALERFAAFMLLSNGYVQEDIGLSDAQRAGLRDVLMLAAKSAETDRSAGDALAQNEEIPITQQVQELAKTIDAVLTPLQISRLQQIALQQRGPFAFKSPEVATVLNLTTEQRIKINAIIEEESPARRGPGRGGMPRGWDDFGGRPEFGSGPPPRHDGPPHDGPPHDGEHGPGGKKGGPFDFGGPRGKKGPGRGPPPGDFGEFDDRGPRGGPGPAPPEGERGGDGRGPGRPPPGGKFGGDDRGYGGPPPGGRGGKGFGEPGGRGGGPGPRPGPELRLAIERTIQRIVALLTPEQQAKWHELAGPPFRHELPWRLE